MSEIWKELIDAQCFFERQLENYSDQVTRPEKFNSEGFWSNKKYFSHLRFREAHVSAVDARNTRGLYMMHLCIFPHKSNDGPIFGFDVIAGKNKVTGMFCDLSSTVHHDHELNRAFGKATSDLMLSKQRSLPDWAKNIFSDYMIAGGNIRDLEELKRVLAVVKATFLYYLDHISFYNGNSMDELVESAQNNYCYWQRQNPHTPKTMEALGLSKQQVSDFIEECLFPENA